jgi:hypothetical protein
VEQERKGKEKKRKKENDYGGYFFKKYASKKIKWGKRIGKRGIS